MSAKPFLFLLSILLTPALVAVTDKEIIASLLTFLPSEEREQLEANLTQEAMSPDVPANAERLRSLRKALEQRATLELARNNLRRTGENLHLPEQPTHSFEGVWQTLSACTVACIAYLIVAAIQDEDASSIIKQQDSPLRPLEKHQANLKRCAEANIRLAELIHASQRGRAPV